MVTLSNVVVSAISVLMFALTAGCSGIPSADERKGFLSEEQFSPGYKVGVTSVIKKPNVEKVLVPFLGALFAVGALDGKLGTGQKIEGPTPLEKIDLAMKTSLESHLPVSASFLARTAYGGSDFVSQTSNIAFDALQQAKAQGFDAMLFVHLQPTLETATGFGGGRLSLTGTPVFRSVRTNHLLYFETYRNRCADGQSIDEEQLPSVLSVCTDSLILSMKSGLDAALASRVNSAPAAQK